MTAIHKSVLLNEVLELSGADNARLMFDMNLGEGGHTFSFLNKYPQLKVIGVDADEKMIERANERLFPFKDRFKSVHAWSDEFLSSYKGEQPDLILFDLGLCMYHFKEAQRGFSFTDEKLDMRLDENSSKSAYTVVNTYSEEALRDILYKFGGEKNSRRIAGAIVKYRKNKKINSSSELHEIISGCFSVSQRTKSKTDVATRSFQALRIEVNDELKRFQSALLSAYEILNVNGRIEVISFHSLEDGIAKWTFRSLNADGKISILTKKPVVPSDEELTNNPSSRSSKLRVAVKEK